jgi:DNA-binding CsgD family transcriptional regulator/tetratricopeptide (TPR) repeat protein
MAELVHRLGTEQPGFVGREAESALLDRLLVSAAAGHPRAVAVLGEAGVGKSRLLSEFADRARTSGTRVLTGWCVPLGAGEIPYAPLIDALRRLVREVGAEWIRERAGSAYADLAHLVADFTAEDAEPAVERDSQLRVFGAVLRLLDLLGSDRAVVLVLEDLHWADSSTLDLVAYLARVQTDERTLLVCSYRSSDPEPHQALKLVMTELGQSHRIERLELAPFTPAELRKFLATALNSDVNRGLVGDFFVLSDGNAFFAEELVAAGTFRHAEGGDAQVLPGSLRELVLARFELLGDDAHEVMRVAATAGRRVSHRLLATVCDLDERRLLAALRECVSRHVLVVDPANDTYFFRHALFREAVHQELLPGERLALHASMATALTSDTGLSYAEDLTVAAELSYHWFEARVFEKALPAAVLAGATALRVRAFPEAERQYGRALEVWPRLADTEVETPLTHDQLLAVAAEAARWAGHVDRAVELIERALAQAPSTRRGALRERLGSYLWEAGDSAGSKRAYAEAHRILSAEEPSAVVVRVLAGRAIADVRAGSYESGFRLAGAAVDMAQAIGAKAEEGRALNILGVAQTMLGRTTPGIEALREALRIAESTDHLEDLYRAYGNLVLALESACRLEESVSVALEGLAHARRFGLELARCGGVLANNASVALVLLGRWEEAAAIIAEVLLERPVRESLYPRLTLAEIAVARGEFDEAGRLLTAVREAGQDSAEPAFVGAWYVCEAERALWQHQYDVARSAVKVGLAELDRTEDIVVLLRMYALGMRVEADDWARVSALPGRSGREHALFASAVDDLCTRADALLKPGDSQVLPEAEALCLTLAAERTRFDGSATPARWAEAGRSWDALDRPHPAAYTRWREAEAAVLAHQTAVATRAARSAHRSAVRLGAEPLRREIEALARHARLDLADPLAPAARPATPADPFGLTAREREVLRHLCAGHTNRRIAKTLYITEKTASVHVSRILMKLGVTNRTEAAAVAHRLNLDLTRNDREK